MKERYKYNNNLKSAKVCPPRKPRALGSPEEQRRLQVRPLCLSRGCTGIYGAPTVCRGLGGRGGSCVPSLCSQPPCPAPEPPLCGCGERQRSAVGRRCLSAAGSNPGLRPCRLAEAAAGLRGSILSFRGASASEDCIRATCVHLQRERQTETQRDGERQRHTHTEAGSILPAPELPPSEGPILGSTPEALGLRVFFHKQAAASLSGGLWWPCLEVGPQVPHGCSEVLEGTKKRNSYLFPPVDISMSLFKMHTFGYIKPNYRKLPSFS